MPEYKDRSSPLNKVLTKEKEPTQSSGRIDRVLKQFFEPEAESSAAAAQRQLRNPGPSKYSAPSSGEQSDQVEPDTAGMIPSLAHYADAGHSNLFLDGFGPHRLSAAILSDLNLPVDSDPAHSYPPSRSPLSAALSDLDTDDFESVYDRKGKGKDGQNYVDPDEFKRQEEKRRRDFDRAIALTEAPEQFYEREIEEISEQFLNLENRQLTLLGTYLSVSLSRIRHYLQKKKKKGLIHELEVKKIWAKVLESLLVTLEQYQHGWQVKQKLRELSEEYEGLEKLEKIYRALTQVPYQKYNKDLDSVILALKEFNEKNNKRKERTADIGLSRISVSVKAILETLKSITDDYTYLKEGIFGEYICEPIKDMDDIICSITGEQNSKKDNKGKGIETNPIKEKEKQLWFEVLPDGVASSLASTTSGSISEYSSSSAQSLADSQPESETLHVQDEKIFSEEEGHQSTPPTSPEIVHARLNKKLDDEVSESGTVTPVAQMPSVIKKSASQATLKPQTQQRARSLDSRSRKRPASRRISGEWEPSTRGRYNKHVRREQMRASEGSDTSKTKVPNYDELRISIPGVIFEIYAELVKKAKAFNKPADSFMRRFIELYHAVMRYKPQERLSILQRYLKHIKRIEMDDMSLFEARERRRENHRSSNLRRRSVRSRSRPRSVVNTPLDETLSTTSSVVNIESRVPAPIEGILSTARKDAISVEETVEEGAQPAGEKDIVHAKPTTPKGVSFASKNVCTTFGQSPSIASSVLSDPPSYRSEAPAPGAPASTHSTEDLEDWTTTTSIASTTAIRDRNKAEANVQNSVPEENRSRTSIRAASSTTSRDASITPSESMSNIKVRPDQKSPYGSDPSDLANSARRSGRISQSRRRSSHGSAAMFPPSSSRGHRVSMPIHEDNLRSNQVALSFSRKPTWWGKVLGKQTESLHVQGNSKELRRLIEEVAHSKSYGDTLGMIERNSEEAIEKLVRPRYRNRHP